jgi:hypothetical protein
MKETMKAIAIYVGKTYSGQMQTELQERKRFIIQEPEPPKAAQDTHKAQIASWQEDIDMEIQWYTDTIAQLLEVMKADPSVVIAIGDLKLKMAKLEKVQKSDPPQLVLTGKDLMKYNSDWKRYTSQTEKLDPPRMQVASLLLGQISYASLTYSLGATTRLGRHSTISPRAPTALRRHRACWGKLMTDGRLQRHHHQKLTLFIVLVNDRTPL